jgi:hypothetical protein
MKRDLAISLIHNLGEILAIDPAKRTGNQILALAKLKARLRDAYLARSADTKWWERDVEKHAERSRVLAVCIDDTGTDPEVVRILEERRSERRALKTATQDGSVA